MTLPKILILGDNNSGKTTARNYLVNNYGYTGQSSSDAALDLFLFKELQKEFGYKTLREAVENKEKDRTFWQDTISKFNTPEKDKLCKLILEKNSIYDGMRDPDEYEECKKYFRLVLFIENPNNPVSENKLPKYNPLEMYLIINDIKEKPHYIFNSLDFFMELIEVNKKSKRG